MSKYIYFPIRLKILTVLLLTTSIVVGAITFTMANSFHRDKTSYIHDLTSVMAQHTAEETRAVLEDYRGRLRMYLLFLDDPEMTGKQKADKIRALFAEFPEFLAVTVYDQDGKVESTVFDEAGLSAEGLAREDLFQYRDGVTLPWERIRSGEIVANRSEIGDRLACLNLILGDHRSGSGDWTAVAAQLRLDGLQRLAARSRIYECYLLDDAGRILVHTAPGGHPAAADRPPEILDQEKRFSAGMTREYSVDGREMVGGFATTRFGGISTVVQIPKRAAYLASRELLKTLLVTSLVLLLVAALAGLFWSRRLTRPIERLSAAARDVGQGHFHVRVDIASRDEIGLLGGSFNQMTSGLEAREKALRETQAQLLQSEKMAAFGQLGAGIAHEVKNPLAGILGCAQLSLLSVNKGSEEEKNLRLIEKETRRCKDIIENLLRFARQDKAEMSRIEIPSVIRDAAAIVNHQLEVNRVKLEMDIQEGLPQIMGNANQLQQVILNLVINAQQAMEGGVGWIRIHAAPVEDGAEVVVEDTGPGIPEDNLKRIFEPFFTTKRGGKGTGLGLSVSYGIIKDHHGEIEVESTEGQGTTFRLRFPAADAREDAPPARAA